MRAGHRVARAWFKNTKIISLASLLAIMKHKTTWRAPISVAIPQTLQIKGTSFHCHSKFSTACLDHVIQDNMNEQQISNQIPSTTASNADCIDTLITTLP